MHARVTYRVNPNKVAAEVQEFSGAALHYWNACLAEIAIDPHPREGRYVERAPFPPFSLRTYLYWITEEISSLSGENMFVFVAEFFPEYSLVYVVNHDESEVDIFYLRAGR